MKNSETCTGIIEIFKEKFNISELREILEEWAYYDYKDKEAFIFEHIPQNIIVKEDALIRAIKSTIDEKINEYDQEHLAAAKYFEEEPDEIEEESWDHYGLRVFSSGSMEIAVGDDDVASTAAEEYIKDTLWAFNAEFIAEHTQIGYKEWFVNAIKALQESKYESANDDILDMIEDLDEFINDAIVDDGRGHFLNSYSGEEDEIKINGITYYVYRIN